MDAFTPILQGTRSRRGEVLRHDLSFRPTLTELKLEWQVLTGVAGPADGFVLTHDLKLPRKRATYSLTFLNSYETTLKHLAGAVKQPVQYAGPGEWSVFARPERLENLGSAVAVPGARPSDLCLIVDAELWRSFQELSLWIEALCVHEWSLFTEGVAQPSGARIGRGEVYRLLTERPDNRRPLTWERNQIDLLLFEGHTFRCPWSHKVLALGRYDIDHIVPVSVYPINELWNLVPSDPRTNSHIKRARVPSLERWRAAVPFLAQTYRSYSQGSRLASSLHHDVTHRFSRLRPSPTPEQITGAVGDFVQVLAESRNLPTF